MAKVKEVTRLKGSLTEKPATESEERAARRAQVLRKATGQVDCRRAELGARSS